MCAAHLERRSHESQPPPVRRRHARRSPARARSVRARSARPSPRSRFRTSSRAARSTRAISATAWCRKFAADVEKRTNGALKFDIYPNSSLVKVNSQFSALRKGALDLSLVPLSYAGGEVPETNIGLLPALVPSYEVGSKWKNAEVGKFLSQILAEKGVIDRHVDLAGRRRREPAASRWSRRTTPRA